MLSKVLNDQDLVRLYLEGNEKAFGNRYTATSARCGPHMTSLCAIAPDH